MLRKNKRTLPLETMNRCESVQPQVLATQHGMKLEIGNSNLQMLLARVLRDSIYSSPTHRRYCPDHILAIACERMLSGSAILFEH